MGSLFRSEKMTLAQLFLQSEAAYACIRELGELGKVQFRDLNPEVSAFQRKFINEVRRCDEMERKLRFLRNELEKAGIEVQPSPSVEAPDPQSMIDLETKFEVLEGEVKEINGNKETLKKNLLDLIELQYILLRTQGFFEEAEQTMYGGPPPILPAPSEPRPASPGDEKALLDTDEEDTQYQKKIPMPTKFTFVTGVIKREKMPIFERVLWRACRGNVFLRRAEIDEPLEDPTTGLMEHKVVFILFFQGDQLRSRVRKICEGFRATLYQCPETAAEREEMTVAVDHRIHDLNSVLETTEDHSNKQFRDIALEIDVWQTKVKKIKGIYHTMNMFNLDVTQRCLIAECWCPVEDLDEIQNALGRGTERSGSTVPSILNRMKSDDQPPTYNKLNKFTSGFQAIIDAYGLATYEEVNPAPYSIITFPFLFAVMFGDAGHGIIMALFSLLLIIFEKRLAKATFGGEIFQTIFGGRYIIFLMGLFSIYTGFIYNDLFSKSINIFGSSWNAGFTNVANGLQAGMGDPSPVLIGICCGSRDAGDYHNTSCVIMGAKEAELTTFPREAMKFHQPYPIGIDPVWNVAYNKLTFLNSYKMKMAIVLGVFQMLFGVCLGVFNHVHFKRYFNIYMEFIPQVIFLLCIFGWLVFMVIYKWSYYYEDPNQAPSLLITLINMFLAFGSAPSVNATATGVELEKNLYSVFAPSPEAANFQRIFHVLLVILAVICIPWMLCFKPFYLFRKNKKKQKASQRNGSSYNVAESDSTASDEEQIIHHASKEEEAVGPAALEDLKKDKEVPHFDFGETFITQAIHTIEYCLGTISNTASYLRLWALSLAHAELSEVLWTMGIDKAVAPGARDPVLGAIALFFIWAAWAAETVVILLVMEGLSAFLHALRLHWVEFQNKFYDGNGYRFKPFSFEAILKGEDQDD